MPVLAAEMSPPAIVCCQPRKPAEARDWWSFREIAGKACWYAGRPGKPKDELRWCTIVAPEHPPEAAPEIATPPKDTDSGAVSIPPGGFEDRWLGLKGCYGDRQKWDCRAAGRDE